MRGYDSIATEFLRVLEAGRTPEGAALKLDSRAKTDALIGGKTILLYERVARHRTVEIALLCFDDPLALPLLGQDLVVDKYDRRRVEGLHRRAGGEVMCEWPNTVVKPMKGVGLTKSANAWRL